MKVRLFLRTSDDFDLCNTMTIPENDAYLRGCCAFLCELADIVDHLVWCELEPGWDRARVWNG